MTIDLNLAIAVIGVALSVGTFFIGRMSKAKTDGAADGELKADIKYIKTSVEKQEKKLDGVAENYHDIREEMEELKGRMNALEQKVKMLHGGA